MPATRRRARPIAILALAAGLILSAGPGMAQTGYEARYEVATTGVDVGRAELSLEPADGGVAAALTFATDALLGLVDASVTRMHTSLRRDGRHLMPDFYTVQFEKKERSREIDATFAADGAMATYTLTKRGRVRVEQVPEGLGPETVDPLTAILRTRTWLEGAMEGDTLPLEIFDGRKRYATSLRYRGVVQSSVAGESRAAHRVTARYRLVAELDEDEGGWLEPDSGRERDLDLLVSADGRYVPLRLTGSFDGTPLSAVLAADCPAPPGCATD